MLDKSSLFNRPDELDFENLFTQLDQELGRDSESLILFEWALEDAYASKFESNREYLEGRPDLMNIINESLFLELDNLLKRFEELEEYEKCAIVLKVTNELKKAFK